MEPAGQEMKQCTRCWQVFPATLDYFYRRPTWTDEGNRLTGKQVYPVALRSQCKTCHKAVSEAARRHFPEAFRRRNRESRRLSTALRRIARERGLDQRKSQTATPD